MQYLLGKGRKDKSGDFTKGAELEESQIKEIINFLNIKNLSDKNFEKIKEIAADNKSMKNGIKELAINGKIFFII